MNDGRAAALWILRESFSATLRVACEFSHIKILFQLILDLSAHTTFTQWWKIYSDNLLK